MNRVTKVIIVNRIKEVVVNPKEFAKDMLKWDVIMFSDIRDHVRQEKYSTTLALKEFLAEKKCLVHPGKNARKWSKSKQFIKLLEGMV